ncbi:VIT and VWA domain-containing protein [Clostridium sp.]|uniref:VIT and VWA domain-containing protein n=1 Tax=Clostridium sp. TaxID=1506 RepID=UPI003464E6BD
MRNYGFINSSLDKSPMKLRSVDIKGNICGEFSQFTISQVYENTGRDHIEGVYTFPIPDTGILSGFEANIGGRTLRAITEDKYKVSKMLKKQSYKGMTKLSLEEDDNIYKITIGNIMPNEKIVINISYIDQLTRENNDQILTIPFIETPKAMNYDDINEESEVNEENYDLSMNLLIETFNNVKVHSDTHRIKVDYETPTLCKVSIEEGENLDNDLELVIREDKSKGFYGMYYSFPKHESDESLIYLKLYPRLEKAKEEKGKNYVFLLDTSQSMRGEKLDEAKSALELCLRNLDEGDTFNIVAFHKDLVIFNEGGNVAVTEDNIKSASKWLRILSFGRGANIYKALKWTLDKTDKEDPSIILLFTDDEVEEESEILSYVKENIGENRIFPIGIDTSVNSYFINSLGALGYGKPEFIYPGEILEDMILRQFNRINSPEVDVREIIWGENNSVINTFPRTIEYLYDREVFTAFGRIKGDIEGPVIIRGFVGDEPFEKVINLENFELNDNAYLIEKVWSRKRIEAFEERILGERGEAKEEMRNKIIDLSKDFNIISSETSFIMIEEMDDPVLGMAMRKLIPIEMSEETMFNLSYAYFMESPAFLYKVKVKKELKNRNVNKENIKEAVKYNRDNLIRTIAKYQNPEGDFNGDMEITLKALIAMLIGKEDISIYSKQINKAVNYMVNFISKGNELNEKNTLLYLLCLQLIDIKEAATETNELKVRQSLGYIKELIEDNEYISNAYLNEEQDLNDIKESIKFMFSLICPINISADEIQRLIEEENIDEILNVAICKAM